MNSPGPPLGSVAFRLSLPGLSAPDLVCTCAGRAYKLAVRIRYSAGAWNAKVRHFVVLSPNTLRYVTKTPAQWGAPRRFENKLQKEKKTLYEYLFSKCIRVARNTILRPSDEKMLDSPVNSRCHVGYYRRRYVMIYPRIFLRRPPHLNWTTPI